MLDHKIRERFLAKVERKGPVQPHMATACWLWTAYCDTDGYGQFSVQGRMQVQGRTHRAHRIAYCTANDMSLDELREQGLQVLHHCDIRRCVRPSHLYAGTAQDNMDDKVRRGREHHPNGALHGRAKLTEADVLEIRALAGTASQRAIGDKFGVAQPTIGRLIRRLTWKHVK